MTGKDRKLVGIWLLAGAVMILIQVIIGGITRLTESGLSITEWEVVTGTLPPLNENQWQVEFNKYQESPEYQKRNVGMSLSEFKFIYFWEYLHRLWARLLGFVFLIPFLYFLIKKKMDRLTIRKSLVAFLLGGLAGLFGWIMVISGLQDRPMVSPYRLAIHLAIAIGTLLYLLWIAMQQLTPRDPLAHQLQAVKRFSTGLIVLTVIQVLFGALMSGMEAAKVYPTWPDMNNAFIPGILLESNNWSWNAFVNFNKDALPHALVNFVHRNMGYIIFILGLLFTYQGFKKGTPTGITRKAVALVPIILFTQVLLGILTILHGTAHIPVFLGVAHQGLAILFLAVLLVINYRTSAHVTA
ncbi:MAG: heme A synthase [Bacteroidetes bacterium SW_10_40_5]|nr:MAG: heme A synthase [Bacteroidetes bacterium SW_10_40_5]